MTIAINPVTVPDMDLTARLTLSRQTLYGWREAGGPIGAPEDLMRMIGEEISILEELAAKNPAEAESISLLIEQYEQLRDRVRKRSN